MNRPKPIRALRFRLGDLQGKELAALLGVSVTLLSQVESGTYPRTPWKAVEALKQTFGWSLDDSEAVCAGSIDEARLESLLKPLPDALPAKVRRRLGALLKARAA